MRQIANMTVIRGNGGCEAYMNGIVQEEIRRQQAQMQAERKADEVYTRMVKGDRDQLRAERSADLTRTLTRRPNLLQRLCAPVVNAWAMFWALVLNAGEIFVNWCIIHGMIEVVEDWDA